VPNVLAAGLALVGGIALALQVAINAHLSRVVGHPLTAALISVGVSAVCMVAALLVLRIPLPSRGTLGGVAPWVWAGGALGAAYVTLSILAVPRLGAAVMVAVAVTGQLATALLLDHFGAFGLAAHGISPWRVAGAAALVIGVVLIRFF
jgi:transporter family-2 protein